MFKRKKYDYDLIVIGSGAGGSVGAHYAASLGKKVAIVEKGAVGGECPNIACVPTKALLYSAHVYETALNSAPFGVDVKDVSFDFEKIHSWKNLVVSRTGAAHGEESFKEENIDLIKGFAKFLDHHTVEVGDKKYTSSKFLIATGSKVFITPIEGLEDVGYITFEQAIDYQKLPKSIFILGGGAVGCEFAQIFQSFGVKVTIADSLPKLLAKEDSETSDLVQALFENRGIKVITNATIFRVTKSDGKKIIHFKLGDEEHTSEADEILVASGKRPVLSFAPEKAGIKIDKGRLLINKHLRTNVKNIFAAGDVIGPFLLTNEGYYQSYIAVNNAFSRKKRSADYSVVPRCVFINPEVASVGISEQEAKVKGIKTKKGIVPISIMGRANTSNEFDGFVKIITDKKERIIGGAIVAPNAGEIIHEIALAVRLKVKAKVIAEMMHAYPTFAETVKIACSSIE